MKETKQQANKIMKYIQKNTITYNHNIIINNKHFLELKI